MQSLSKYFPDEQATARFAARVAALARPGDAILLSGPLGAGKTAFARAFLRAAAGDPGLRVASPTFTLAQNYALPSGITATHYDLWRLSGARDVAELGFEDSRAGIVLVEWPDRLGALAPSDALRIELALVGDHVREAKISGWPDRLAALA
jgi:tRNA threonylcarbamoyladenosine biosynthesis protein TsaE